MRSKGTVRAKSQELAAGSAAALAGIQLYCGRRAPMPAALVGAQRRVRHRCPRMLLSVAWFKSRPTGHSRARPPENLPSEGFPGKDRRLEPPAGAALAGIQLSMAPLLAGKRPFLRARGPRSLRAGPLARGRGPLSVPWGHFAISSHSSIVRKPAVKARKYDAVLSRRFMFALSRECAFY